MSQVLEYAPAAVPAGPATRAGAFLLRHAPTVLFALVILTFCALAPGFRTLGNARNILVQSSSVAIVATGMTFVLLTAGIDLSVGAIMFVAAAVAGRLVLGGWLPGVDPIPVWLAVLLIVPLGLAFGAVNAALVARLRMMPFIVTLATLFIGRGVALHVTETRALNLPPAFVTIGHASVLGIPFPVLLLAAVLVAGQFVLARTPFGRQLYAMGNNPDAARKAGLPTARLLAAVYLISGFCAALAGIVSVAQLGSVSPTFGAKREFDAVAAAVLGGTSLFGGRGTVLPGALIGALLVQSVETGLTMVNADPYSYPVLIGGIILVAVLIDRLRQVTTFEK
jgi:ribose transport system permease protein